MFIPQVLASYIQYFWILLKILTTLQILKPSKLHIFSKCWQHISNKNIHPPSVGIIYPIFLTIFENFSNFANFDIVDIFKIILSSMLPVLNVACPQCPGPNCLGGPNCPGPNCPGPSCPGPDSPGPNLPRILRVQCFHPSVVQQVCVSK